MMNQLRRRKVLVVYGTRPEAVKMAPVIRALSSSSHLRPIVVVTGQHRSMLDQVNRLFSIEPDYDLDLHRPGQTLTDLTTKILTGLENILPKLKPDVVLVQGDTTTSFAAALAAFYGGTPVVHLEAGLRTHNARSPFPEEINRRLTTRLASLHLAPTALNKNNLLLEGIHANNIVVTGNTVVDALLWALTLPLKQPYPWRINKSSRLMVVTTHRRESWGLPMLSIASAIRKIAIAHPELVIVFPMHANPVVREAVTPKLRQLPNVHLIEPLSYTCFIHLINQAEFILTDSGGIQEEAAALGKQVLVLRDKTERPEALEAGSSRLIGTNEARILEAVEILLINPLISPRYNSLFGDGHAADRTIAALTHLFGLGPPASELHPNHDRIDAVGV